MSSEFAISVKNISKRFEMYANPKHRLYQMLSFGRRTFFKEFWALNGVSFDVKRGETLGILGRNGEGKSTLLQIIAGTLTATSGSVEVNGKLAALLELGAGFNPEFTGRENVYLSGIILGMTQAEMNDKFPEIEAFADIGEHIDQPVKTYSSGMYVRLAFAVQACIKPEVLIVDEALSVGDEKFQRKCFDYIETLRAQGCSIILVTHSTSTVEKFCQRAILLRKGRVEAIGTAKEIIDQYHALLYSDEKTYLRYLNNIAKNTANAQENSSKESQDTASTVNSNETEVESLVPENELTSGALIEGWVIKDINGQPCDLFRVREKAIISFDISVFGPIEELQAGLVIKTVEGITVFGSSTLYHQKNMHDAKGGDVLRATFELELALCEGTYFVSLAIANAISHADMSYLDKKTDVIILKVIEPRITMSGIAALPFSLSLEKWS